METLFLGCRGLLKVTRELMDYPRFDESAAVTMAQAMEQLCLGLLYSFWGYRPVSSLNLMYIVQLTETITPMARHLFCLDNPSERVMVTELANALNNFRYKPGFDVDGFSLHILHNRLLTFSSKVEALVEQHFKTMEGSALHENS